MDEAQKRKMREAPRSAPVINPVLKLRDNPTSRAAAIKAMCAQCMGCTDEGIEPAFRDAIRNCTASHCALYAVRPYQK